MSFRLDKVRILRKEIAMSALIALVILVLDIVAIVDIIKSSVPTGKKVLWTILVLVFPFLGMILYFLLGKKKA